MTVEDIDAVADLTARVIGGGEEYDEIFALTRAANESCPFMPVDLCWVVEEDGRIVAKWQGLDMTIRAGRIPIKMIGAQALVAEKAANGKGYPKLLLLTAYPQVVACGYTAILGFAQRGALYRRLGAAPVMAEYEMRLDARRIPPLADDPFRPLEDADVPRMIGFYEESNATRSGTLVRTPALWPWMVRRAPDTLLCDSGYLGMRVNEDSLEIREVGGTQIGFYDLALRKAAAVARDNGHRRIIAPMALDHPAAEMAIHYGAEFDVSYPKKSGGMAAVLDVPGFLDSIAPELEERVCRSPFGDTRVELTLHGLGRTGHLTLNPGGEKDHKIDFDLSVGALLQLAFGYRSARSVLLQGWSPGAIEASAQGSAEQRPEGGDGLALDEASWELLDVMFPQSHPFMWHTDRF